MLRARSLLAPCCRSLRRIAALCAAGALLLPAGCQVNLPMRRLLLNGVPTPSPLSRGATPPLQLTVPHEHEEEDLVVPPARLKEGEEEANSSEVTRTSYQENAEDPNAPPSDAPPALLPAPADATRGVSVNYDGVLRMTFERNAEIQVSREHVNESVIALDAALRSCMPEAFRKDVFKKPVAEAEVWRRRVELRKVETDNLQDASNTYFDWLTAQRGEVVSRDLLKYEEKLLDRARKLGEIEKPTQVLVNTTETAISGRQQFLSQMHQQGEAAAVKLAYLMGMNGGQPITTETAQPVDRADTSLAVEVLVQQAQTNGPGVRELQGLIAAIQQGIEQAHGAQCLCARTGAALVCGRLQMAQSQLQQAQLSLLNLQGKLRAGVEESVSAILSGREQIARAAEAIQNAGETYRLMDLRLTKQSVETTIRNNTHNAVLSSIQQLSQAHANYLKAVNDYNKAQGRLLLLLGTYTDCAPHSP